MAGLVGYHRAALRAVPAVLLGDLADGLRHRGPDAFGAWWDRDAGIALGHRLRSREVRAGARSTGRDSVSVEEPRGSVGPAPAVSRSGRWVLVLDGRIDNVGGLHAALGDRSAPRGMVAQAELLVEAFDRWGADAALERVDGAFAVAAWDREGQRLVLARDAFGQRPLVYASVDGGLVFGSELGALRRFPGFDSSLDPRAVALFLRFKYVPSPHTIHAGARKLPPGHVLSVTAADSSRGVLPDPKPLSWFHDMLHRSGDVSRRSDDVSDRAAVGRHAAGGVGSGGAAGLSSPGEGRDASDETAGGREALDRLDDALSRSVRAQLSSNRPLIGSVGDRAVEDRRDGEDSAAPGALLSGGIDSTLVSAIAAEQLGEPLRTFTIGSDDPDLDESSEARAIAAYLGAEHTELHLDGAAVSDAVVGLANHWDEPFADSSQLPMLLVSRLARTEVTAALAGDGGDELFGGYNRHLWLPRTWRRIGSVPAPVRSEAAGLLQRPSPAMWDRLARVLPRSRRPRMVGLKAAKFASVLGAVDEADAYGRLVSHWPDPIGLLAPDFAGAIEEPTTLAHDRSRWPQAPSLAETIMAVDLCTYLPDDVLVKVDRATAAVGLDACAPLLGREVVELSFALPLEAKIADGVGKAPLRKLIARRLPAELVEGPKSGFGVPIARWLRGPLRPWAEDLLSEGALRRGGLLAPAPIRAAWAQHLDGTADRSYELWDVLMLLSWRAS